MEHDWELWNYIEGQQLTRIGQERYAERHGNEMRSCIHCYHVEDGESCCGCHSTGITDNKDYWEQSIGRR